MRTQNHFRRFSAFAIVMSVVAACASTPQIAPNTDPTANLSSYKTYGFVPQPGTNRGGNSTPLTTHVETSISRQMDARGYRTYVESAPGPAPMGYYGYRGGVYAGGLHAEPEVETVRYKVGTANIVVVDTSQRKVVWEGRAEGELTDAAMKNRQGAVDKVVTQLFAQFPGRAAAS